MKGPVFWQGGNKFSSRDVIEEAKLRMNMKISCDDNIYDKIKKREEMEKIMKTEGEQRNLGNFCK